MASNNTFHKVPKEALQEKEDHIVKKFEFSAISSPPFFALIK